jgi:NADH pyrophosphatase NudC (nudix superfamily)
LLETSPRSTKPVTCPKCGARREPRVEQRGRGKDKIRIVVYPTHEPAKQKEEIGAA